MEKEKCNSMEEENAEGERISNVFMERALEQAKMALVNMEVPVGGIIVEDGKLISSRSNMTNCMRNATRHAEMEALDKLLNIWNDQPQLNKSIYNSKRFRCASADASTMSLVICELCIMRAAAPSILGIRKVIYGCKNDRVGDCGSLVFLYLRGCRPCGYDDNVTNSMPVEDKGFECIGGFMADEAVELSRTFYE